MAATPATWRVRATDGDARRPLPGRLLPWLIGAVVIAVLMTPMVFSGSTFGGDWPTHLWLIQMQARNISSLGHPSLFVQSSLGAFEPWFAFYGGTLYSIVGAASVLSGGHTLVVYILSFALAIAMAYGGFAWLGKQAGLKGWYVQVAPFAFVTSAYYISDIFARGAWPETVATSAIPLVVAAGTWLLRAKSWRIGPVLAFVVGVIVFSGSHNITLLFGTIYFALLCVTLAVAIGRASLPPARRMLAVAALGVVAAGVNLWFVLPDVVFESKVTIGHSFNHTPSVTGGLPLWLLLSPFRTSQVPHFPTLDMQIPTLALLWSIAALALGWHSLAPVWRRISVALAVAALPFFALLAVPDLWHAVPKLLWSIQFPYRLLSYVDFSVVGLVLIGVLALVAQKRTRARRALIVVGLVFALAEGGQAVYQAWHGPSSLPSRGEAFPGGSLAPSYWDSFVTYLQYQDVSTPVVSATIPEVPGLTFYNGEGANVIPVPVTKEPKESYTVEFTPSKSGTVNTDVIAGPYLVGVKGAKFVGRTPYSEMVISVKKHATGPTRVTFSTARSWPIVVGEWLTFVCVILLVGLLAALGARKLGLLPARRRSGT